MLTRHSFITATTSHWVYTLDHEGFKAWLTELAATSIHEARDEDHEQLIRIARQVGPREGLTERQWRRMQAAFTQRH